MKKIRRNRPALGCAIEGLEIRRLLASTYEATLVPLNNSRVAGTARAVLDGNQLTVTINATNLEANQVHPQQIHGRFQGGNSTGTPSDSVVPTTENDTDKDGFIEHNEALAATGAAILPLSTPPGDDSKPDPLATLKYPTADANGAITFTQVYDVTVATQFFDPDALTTARTGQDLLPLDLRVIELHGLTVTAEAGANTSGEVNGTAGYKSELPVAAGEFRLVPGDGDDGNAGTEGVFTLPAGTTGEVSLPVQWTDRQALYDNEVGFFLTDDVEGKLNGLAPGDPGWAEAAMRSSTRQIIFASGSGAGANANISLSAGQNVVFYIVQNTTSERFLATNPTNQVGSGPLALFSITAANPDAFKHVRFTTATSNGTSTTEMRWEDLTNGGDEDFDDVVMTVNLVPAGSGGTTGGGDTGGGDTGGGGGVGGGDTGGGIGASRFSMAASA